MATIEVRGRIEADPDAVWAVAGDFGAADAWIASIESARMEGDVRHAVLDRGRGSVAERLVSHSDAERSFEYELIAAGASLKSFHGRFVVSADGSGAQILWRGELEGVEGSDEEQLAAGVRNTYERSIENLRELVGASSA